MSRPVVTVKDHVKWGKLIMSWAKGINVLSPGSPVPPIPRTIAELAETAAAHKIDIDFASVTELVVVQPTANTMVLTIPPKVLIEAVEQELEILAAKDEPYPVPDIYNIVYHVSSLRVPRELIKDFHAGRIGDYTISNCA